MERDRPLPVNVWLLLLSVPSRRLWVGPAVHEHLGQGTNFTIVAVAQLLLIRASAIV